VDSEEGLLRRRPETGGEGDCGKRELWEENREVLLRPSWIRDRQD
jgi:hypothetical protein